MSHALYVGSAFIPSTSSEARTAGRARHAVSLAEPGEIYQLVKRGEIDPREVEMAGTQVVEVSVLWETAILYVGYLSPSQNFDLATHGKPDDPTTFIVDESMLPAGTCRLPVVMGGEHGCSFAWLPSSPAEVEIDGEYQPLNTPNAHKTQSVMRDGERYRMRLGSLTISARLVAAGRRVVGKPQRDPAWVWAGLGAACLVGALVASAIAAASPSDSYVASDADTTRLALLQNFVRHQQDRQLARVDRGVGEGMADPGTRHAGPDGQMGPPIARPHRGRYEIRRRDSSPSLSRRTTSEAQSAGVLGALGSPALATGAVSGPRSPFGLLEQSGHDSQDRHGNLQGEVADDSFGYGGLGTLGAGWGGGGHDETAVGTGLLHTLGHGSDTGPGQRIGTGVGTRLAARATTGPTVRMPTHFDTVGTLSSDAIRRVVLRNLGQVRHCHEQGLAQNPALGGRVVVRFVIGGDGNVLASSVGENSVPLPGVAQCIAGAVRRWQFPAPEGSGTVAVTYPFTLEVAP
jgi:hypothetical protein